MKIFRDKKKLIKEISRVKDLGFVPTMGSLHKGHISLINKAKKESKKVLVSIYINAKQFNFKKDFRKYPRNFNKDVSLLKKKKLIISIFQKIKMFIHLKLKSLFI